MDGKGEGCVEGLPDRLKVMVRGRGPQQGSQGLKHPDLTLYLPPALPEPTETRGQGACGHSLHRAASSHQSGQGGGKSGSEGQTDESQATYSRDLQITRRVNLTGW